MLNQSQIFPSKRGVVIYLVIAIMVAVTALFVISGIYVPAIVITALLIFLVGPMFWSTYYMVSSGWLTIKCGLLFKIAIPVEKIRKIAETRSILSAPALSFDRIEIFYNKFDSVVVSPEHKTDFIALLQSINPNIEYLNKHA